MPDDVSTARQTLQDPDGNLSSKRVIGAGAFACLVVAMGADMIGHPVHDHLLDLFAFVVGSGVFGATMDHFAPRRDGDH